MPKDYSHAVASSERLALCPLRVEDASAFEAVFCDAEVMRYSKGVKTSQWVEDWIAHINAELYPAWGFGLWAVHLKESHQVIGYCGLTRFAERCDPEQVEVAFRLARAYWGHGYASEATICACDYGRQALGLTQIIALIDPRNTASVHVATKIGMHFQHETVLEGDSHTEHLYALK